MWENIPIGKRCDIAKISKREFTGVGFYSYFDGYTDDSDMQISNVGGFLNDNIRVGFTLFIKDGNPTILEGYTYDEPWPKEILSYKVFFEK